MITARAVGLPELQRKFKALERVMQERIIKGALVSGALIVANAAKENAPVVTGNLRRSIHVGGFADAEMGSATDSDLSQDASGNWSGSTGTDLGGIAGTKVAVGTNVEYAARIEFGFVGKDSLGRTYNQGGQPYLTKAFEDKKGEAIREIGDAFRAAVKRAV
jgi:HK97 gp10 family phage protein